MNCEGCEALLVDLLYDELRAPEAKEAEAHLKECASCKASLNRLGVARRIAARLPLEEPSAAVLDRIVGAARAHVQDAARERVRHGALWESVLQWLRSFAVGPQVAMATLMLLVVGIGLWYLPQARRGSDATAGTVVNPDHAGEAAPSEAAPALDLDFNPRTGRIRVRDEVSTQTPGAADPMAARRIVGEPAEEEAAWDQAKPEDSFAPPPPSVALAESDAPRSERNRRGARASRGGLGDDEPVAGMDLDGEEGFAEVGAVAQRSDTGGRGAGGSLGSAAAPAREPSDRDRFALAPPASPPSAVARSRTRGGAPVEAVEAESSPAPAAAPAASANAGPARERAVDEAPTGDVVSVSSASADDLLASARAFRARNECAAAVQRYETLFTRFPAASATPAARIEAAQCYQELGQYARARAHLDRAVQDSRVAPTARREIERLEARRVRAAPAQSTE